jgi:hypothetical protein
MKILSLFFSWTGGAHVFLYTALAPSPLKNKLVFPFAPEYIPTSSYILNIIFISWQYLRYILC